MSRLPGLAVIAFAAAVCTASLTAQVPLVGGHLVNVPCCAFQDSTTGNNQTIIPIGTTVNWSRIGITPHTVTSGTGPTDPNAGAIFSGSLAGASTAFSFPFPALGTFQYFCSFHAVTMNMVGTVFVLPHATSTVVGSGCASSAGTLVLGTTGAPAVGNSTFGFTLSGGPAGAQSYLYLSLGIAASPLQVSNGCFAYIDLVSTQQLIAAGATPTGPQALSAGGTTTFSFPLPLNPALGGISGAAQAVVFDAGAPGGGGFAVSNAVSVVVGA